MSTAVRAADLRPLQGGGRGATARAVRDACDAGTAALLLSAEQTQPGGLLLPPSDAGVPLPQDRLTLDELLALAPNGPRLAVRLPAPTGEAGPERVAQRLLTVLERAGSPRHVLAVSDDVRLLEATKALAPLLAVGLDWSGPDLAAGIRSAGGCGADALIVDAAAHAGTAPLAPAEPNAPAVWVPVPPEQAEQGGQRRDLPVDGSAEPLFLVLDVDGDGACVASLSPSRGLVGRWRRTLPGAADGADRAASIEQALAELVRDASAATPRLPTAAAALLPVPDGGDVEGSAAACDAAARLFGLPRRTADALLAGCLGEDGCERRPTVDDHGRLAWPAGGALPVRTLISRPAAALIGAAGLEGGRLLVHVDRSVEVLRARPVPPAGEPERSDEHPPLWTTSAGRGGGAVLLRDSVPLFTPAEGCLDDRGDDRVLELARQLALGTSDAQELVERVLQAAHGAATHRDRAVLVAGRCLAPQLSRALAQQTPLEPLASDDEAELCWLGAARLAAAASKSPWSHRPSLVGLR